MIKETNPIIKEDLKNIISEKLSWSKFKNKNILITGGNGLLASYIIKSLLSANIFYRLNLKIICIVVEHHRHYEITSNGFLILC